MTAEEQIRLALVECDLPPVPPRSRLFSLQPLGLGTGHIESATSYVARLAEAHTVSVWNLIKHEIAPRLYGPNVVLRHRLSELVAAVGSAFNGENRTARTVTEILESLTGRHGLECTTMGFCRGFVASRLLMRPEQGFCPECIAGWREAANEGYSPLIWNLLSVKCCPVHRTPLLTKCPACNLLLSPDLPHPPRVLSWL
jgi:hypothetical protein